MTETELHDLIEDRAKHWQKYFGLMDYELRIVRDESLCDFGTMEASTEDRYAILTYSYKKLGNESREIIELTVFHEICEVLISEMDLALREFYSMSHASAMGHRVIMRLQNSIFYRYWEKKKKNKKPSRRMYQDLMETTMDAMKPGQTIRVEI